MPSDNAAATFEFCQVMTTCSSRADADALGRAVVEARLAPCAQVEGPITSTFWWEGAIQVEEEWRVVLKTPVERYQALAQYIRDNHTYDVPEIVSLPILTGAADYLEWMRTEARPG
jgi:periplasmic divalent cation tolerance protein